MDDREKLIELIESARYWGSNTSAEIADHLIANNVVIQKQGEWNDNIIGFCNVCMECGAIVERGCIKNQSGKLHYCPNCGAKMKEVK